MRYMRLLGLVPAYLVNVTKPMIGGQAVIEGVMMRSPKSFVVAVRKPDQTIVVRERAWLSFSERFPFLKWPLLRGANMLIESMYNGISALQFSAEQALLETSEKKPSDKSQWALTGTLVSSLLLGIVLFKAVPHFAAFGLGVWFGHDGATALPLTSGWFHLVDGSVKMLLFVGYILAISRMKDVQRLFMYHGAEHKAVHSYEKSLDLDVAQTRPQPTAHPRCGTSLILLVLTVSIVVFALVIPFLPVVSDSALLQSLFSLAVKVPLMLPIAGVAYEIQRAAAKSPNNPLIRCLIAPGMMMQRLTTKEPTDDQLEVSLTALRKAVWREKSQAAVHAASDHVETYANFGEVQTLMT